MVAILPEIKQNLVIVGCGGFGRETLGWAMHAQDSGMAAYDSICMVDDSPDFECFPRLKPFYNGTLTNYAPQLNDRVVIAVGDPNTRCRLDVMLSERQAKFGSVIHPTALVSLSSQLGEGAILAPHVVVTTDVTVGRHTHMNIATTVGHDVTIEDFVTLSSHTDITGGCTLGDFVFLGSGARILPGCQIVANTRIGAGCTVMRSVKKPAVFIAAMPKKVTFK